MNDLNKIKEEAKKLADSLKIKRLEFDDDMVKTATPGELVDVVSFFLQFKPNFNENAPGLDKIKHLTREKADVV